MFNLPIEVAAFQVQATFVHWRFFGSGRAAVFSPSWILSADGPCSIIFAPLKELGPPQFFSEDGLSTGSADKIQKLSISSASRFGLRNNFPRLVPLSFSYDKCWNGLSLWSINGYQSSLGRIFYVVAFTKIWQSFLSRNLCWLLLDLVCFLYGWFAFGSNFSCERLKNLPRLGKLSCHQVMWACLPIEVCLRDQKLTYFSKIKPYSLVKHIQFLKHCFSFR